MADISISSELLRIIFEQCEGLSNTNNALVCKRWSETALDILWYEVSDLRRIAELLGSLEISQDSPRIYKYVETPTYALWRRFEQIYAHRIRVFRVNSNTTKYSNILADIARLRSPKPILPNLHTFQWYFPRGNRVMLQYAAMFMHDSVRKVILPSSSWAVTSESMELIQILQARMPSVTCLELPYLSDFDRIREDAAIQRSIVEILRCLPNLTAIVLPPNRDLSHVMVAIPSLPSRISSLTVCNVFGPVFGGNGTTRHLREVNTLIPSPLPNQTSTLTWLALPTHYRVLADFLPNAPYLTHITVFSGIIEKPDDVQFLLSRATNCRRLRHVRLLFHGLRYSSRALRGPFPAPELGIRFGHLEPILTSQNIVQFEIQHWLPLNLCTGDVANIARSWPRLESIMLNQAPASVPDIPCHLNILSLIPFAQHCPLLRTIGILAAAGPLSSTQWGHLPSHFPQLETLHVGISENSGPNDVALFLGRICPSGCSIQYGSHWYEFDQYKSQWDIVANTLPLLIRMRMQMSS